MIKILIVLIYLLFLIYLGSKTFNNYILTPQFAFTVSFVPCLLFLPLFIDKWQVDLDIRTMFVLMGGPTIFFILSAFFWKIRITIGRYEVNNYEDASFTNVHVIDNWKLICFLLVQIFAILLMWLYVRSHASGGSISAILYSFRNFDVNEAADIPTLTSQFRVLSLAIGMFLTFYYFRNREEISLYRGKKILFYFSFILTTVLSVLMGNRGKVIEFFIYAVICAVYTSLRDKTIQKKVIFRAGIIMIIIVVSLRLFANLVGRGITMSWADYIGIYLSASVKNLDTAIRQGNFQFFHGETGGGIANNVTFGNLINWVAQTFGIDSWYSRRGFNTGYQMVGEHELGNVYTTYLPFLQDGGYFGIVVYIFIMVILSLIFYRIAYKNLFTDQPKSYISTILYIRIYTFLLLSFFSQYFYWVVFQMEFFYTIIYFYLIQWFINRVDLGIRLRTTY